MPNGGWKIKCMCAMPSSIIYLQRSRAEPRTDSFFFADVGRKLHWVWRRRGEIGGRTSIKSSQVKKKKHKKFTSQEEEEG
jgi:hypothetical protein